MKFIVLLALFFVCATAGDGKYPSTYPYENEMVETPTVLPSSTPSQTYDDTDPGGYYSQLMNCDPTDSDPYGFYECGPAAENGIKGPWNWLFKKMGASPPMNKALYNCSAKAKYTGDEFPGDDWPGSKVGCGGKVGCCKLYTGHAMFTPPNVELWTTRIPAGNCGDMDEHMYCWIMNPSKDICADRYIDGASRGYVYTCYNLAMHYFIEQCPAFRVGGMSGFLASLESPKYIESLSVKESIIYYTLHLGGDRVCTPYAYYYPDVLSEDTKKHWLWNVPDTGDDDDDDDDSSAPLKTLLGALFVASVHFF